MFRSFDKFFSKKNFLNKCRFGKYFTQKIQKSGYVHSYSTRMKMNALNYMASNVVLGLLF